MFLMFLREKQLKLQLLWPLFLLNLYFYRFGPEKRNPQSGFWQKCAQSMFILTCGLIFSQMAQLTSPSSPVGTKVWTLTAPVLRHPSTVDGFLGSFILTLNVFKCHNIWLKIHEWPFHCQIFRKSITSWLVIRPFEETSSGNSTEYRKNQSICSNSVDPTSFAQSQNCGLSVKMI